MGQVGTEGSAVTPTLVGRWQTRVALLATVGVIVSVPFWMLGATPSFFAVLAWVALFGLAWDVGYTFLQAFRWERDWPPAFAVVAAIAEGALVYLLATRVGLPGLPVDLSLSLFVFHYSTVWLATFFFAQGPMRALFPWWRFHGGRIWPGIGRGQHG
jgi:hypothetical protein